MPNSTALGMRVSAICNRTQEKAVAALKIAGREDYEITESRSEFAQALKSGKTALTTDIDLLTESDEIDVIVELTGQISYALKVILQAFEAGKDVVTFNAELESTFGPYLKKKAKEHNVKYTLGDGDQPGVTMNLYRQVQAMGFTPLVCGNIKGLQDRYRTPSTQKSFAEKWGMNPVMATNFADGTKISFEQACIANATGMVVSERGMKGYPHDGHINDLTDCFDVDMLQEKGGIVDYALGSKPSPGVFVFATANDDFSEKYLNYCKLGEGPLYNFYVPYHLLFFELAFSIARLVDFNDITLDAEYGMKVEVCTFAKQDLKAGTTLDGIGGFHAYGLCENSPIVQKDNLLPMGLCEDMVLKRDIKKDQPIFFDDVEPTTSFQTAEMYKLQMQQ